MLGRNWKNQNPSYIGRDIKWSSHFENSLAVPETVKHRLPYDPALLFLGIYPSEMRTYIHAKFSY